MIETISRKVPTLTSNLAIYRLHSAEKIQWLTRQERRRAVVIILLILFCIGLAITTVVRADVIELTGPFQPGPNEPEVYRNWIQHRFNHDAIHLANEFYPEGWDQNIWIYNGPPQFITTALDQPLVTLSWIRTSYFVRWLFVSGPDPMDFGWLNMYEVTGADRYSGAAVLRINGTFPITAVGVFGTRAYSVER